MAKSNGSTSAEDTAVSPGFSTRVKETLARASREHSDTAAMAPTTQAGKPARRARLRLTRIDPMSVMKTSFLLSVAFGVVTFVAVLIVWTILGAAGLWDAVNDTVATVITSGDQASTFDIRDYVGMGRVLGFTLVVAVIDVILLTAIATLGAFLYNMAAALLGGIELTLSEDSH
ncbi:DUF3566 domain-containing protein [Nocardioides daphniae]|uniref:DUF3566 domain-containing protein n=1 Tax=Nocardioides daphniae TaxID=402297 RepID=A0A4P7U795_9ACTN|nr:DUF3566 domain-containing protein [Nocardioides daphniae]QCC75980.1 DUF3566 domain-containing protein [Nocardioides daphniae]GGD11442.1 hypothetical protein GCM10007231_07790 [Nocardioides daphniae]